MKTTILVIAAVILISFLLVRESYQVIPSSRVPAPAEVSFRNVLAEVTGLPVDLIDIVRGYDFPGQIFNIVQRSNEDLESQIDKMFRQEAKAQLRVVKDKIIKGDITNTLKKLDEITMTDFLDEKVLQWLNPGESFLPSENKSILKKLIKDISEAQKSVSPFPILPNSIALQVDRQMQILSDEIKDIKNLYIFEMAKLDNFIKYP